MAMIKLEIKTEQVLECGSFSATITTYKIEIPQPINTLWTCIGFDVGSANLGVAKLDPNQSLCNIYQVKWERDKDAVKRILDLHHILSDCRMILPNRFRVVIEGAAYNQPYRQVELAELRASAVFWLQKLGAYTKIIAPSTIRKGVFGSGKLKAHEVWYIKNAPDAVAALACAYYASNCWEK